MPVSITKSNGGYRVSTPNGVKAKHTTKNKAEHQRNLLNAVDHGWKPTREALENIAGRIVDTLFNEG